MKSILNFLGLNVLPFLINMLFATLSMNIKNKPESLSNSVFIFWHSKMLAGWRLFKDSNTAALVSQSSDGDILSNLLVKWNYKVIRGSSSKGGKEALFSLMENVSSGIPAAVTPDGPRGPANVIKNGVLVISLKCGAPLIPVRINYRHKIVLSKSWDRFEIPMPFSSCDVYFGEKYYYNTYLYNEELENFKSKLGSEMS
ncbi:MAG: lysophospholipid acyltransferase family protein [Ignavibacteria bacterium]|nr:lysophospholipid acyltransferase family protein [Ignavibacteria bacterium]